MSKSLLPQIKEELKRLYPTHRFEIKMSPSTYTYHIVVSRLGKNVCNFCIPGTATMTEFWKIIKDGMSLNKR